MLRGRAARVPSYNEVITVPLFVCRGRAAHLCPSFLANDLGSELQMAFCRLMVSVKTPVSGCLGYNSSVVAWLMCL